jgi:hypothetical protein
MRRVSKVLSTKQFSTNSFKFQKNSQVKTFADQIQKGFNFFFSNFLELPSNPKLPDILKAVWANPKVTAVCPDLIIRLTSLRGQVSRTIWESLGNVKFYQNFKTYRTQKKSIFLLLEQQPFHNT